MATEWIAEAQFDFVPAQRRKRIRVTVRVGRPFLVPTKGGHPYGRCPVSLAPVIPESWIGGADQFQALCLTLEFIRTVLKAYVAEGGRVYSSGTDLPIGLDDPSFVPISGFAKLVKRSNDRAKWDESTFRVVVNKPKKKRNGRRNA